MIYTQSFVLPIGKILLASRGDALCGLWFEGQKYYMKGFEWEETAMESLPVFDAAALWLDAYFAGEKPYRNFPLEPEGSPFYREIWDLLLGIPYGSLVSYGMLAAEYARRHGLVSMSAQAVGGAVGHNPISIIIPCHRVVGAKGALTGYAGGTDKKLWLLHREGIDTGAVREYISHRANNI